MIKKQAIIDGLGVVYYQGNYFEKENALVFLHGWGSEALHLRSIFQNLENFVALDLPGFGGSDQPKENWWMRDYAGFLDKFLDKLEIKNPILVGHSVGGAIIIKFLSLGGVARKAILISPSGIRKRGLKIFLYKISAKVMKIPFFIPGISFFREKARKKMYKMIDSEDYVQAGTMADIYKKIIREDLSDDMERIETEVVLIWGENDQATNLSQGKITNSLIKKSKLVVIKDTGHYSFIDKPEEFNKIFLNEIQC